VNDLRTLWQGTFEMWQNGEFGEIYAQYNHRKLYFLNGTQLFVSHRPIIGNTTLYSYCGPATGEWIIQLKSFATGLKVATIWIYSINPLEDLKDFSKEEQLTLVIELADEEQIIWKKVGDKTRNMIRKGSKMGVSVELAETEDQFSDWWRIYSDITQTKGFGRQNHFLVKELFLRKNLSKLFVSIKEDKIIGGSFFLVNKYPIYWLGAFDRAYGNVAPGHINIWEAMLHFKKNAYLLMDLGGIASDKHQDGITTFKKSLTREVQKGYIYVVPINHLKRRILEFLSKARR
jgi:lipid II:glycine glycyltransferase (peptidoglycan interpeptide bridge formation enzyme)